MRWIYLAVCVVGLAACKAPNKVALEAMQAHWEALKPYTLDGIHAAPLGDAAKTELSNECKVFSMLIAEELKYAE